MYYAQCPKKTALPREVLKWLQSLDLSFYPKNVRRDFSNGYLVAEIFSHYYPQDFPKQSFDKGASLTAKQKNWSRIERSLQKQNRHLTKDVVDGTIHCKPGAAELLVHEVYSILNNQRQGVTQIKTGSIIREGEGPEMDFTDREYQELLPTLARSTASKALKNNLRITEMMAEPDIYTNQLKAEVILQRHLEHKTAEKMLNPERFKLKHLGKPLAKNGEPSSQGNKCFGNPSSGSKISKSCSSTWSQAAVSFKEVIVHQPVRR